jgi:hypothetical protein
MTSQFAASTKPEYLKYMVGEPVVQLCHMCDRPFRTVLYEELEDPETYRPLPIQAAMQEPKFMHLRRAAFDAYIADPNARWFAFTTYRESIECPCQLVRKLARK